MSVESAVRPRDAQILIKHAMQRNRPMFIWGPPGIGKSEIIEGLGFEENRPVIDLRLLLMEPTDIKGIPFYDPETKSMRWAKPSELPEQVNKITLANSIAKAKAERDALVTDEDRAEELMKAEERIIMLELLLAQQDAILFLDELNAAPPSVQAAAYQLILNRRVGEYKLPPGVSIVAAGNRNTDKGVVYRMPSPLANRFVHIELMSYFEDWQKWAINNGIHPDVVGFLSHHKQNLFNFDNKSPDTAFATPRTWTFVSDLLDDQLPESMETTLVKGCVGEGLGITFNQHRKIAAKLPKPSDILKGKVTGLDIDEVSAMYSLTISMCYTLQEWVKTAQSDNEEDKKYTMDEWNVNIDHFFRYLMDNFKTEMIILGAKTALRDYQLPIDHRKLKNFKEFHQKYGSYILDD